MTNYRRLVSGATLLAVLVTVFVALNYRQVEAQNPRPGSAPVNIVSPLPLPVHNADEDARQPFQIVLCGSNQPFVACRTSLTTFTPSSFTLGAGQSAVIQYVSGNCANVNTAGSMTGLSMVLKTTVGGTTASHQFHLAASFNPNDREIAQQTTIYADPGSNISVQTGVSGTNPILHCNVTISGYTTP